MSFLAPIFMLAIPLLAIPIVLHLWKKRRRDMLPWGAMQFLVNDDHRQRRLSNVDRWLVLLARCLLLLLLIFALTRPLLHSNRYGTVQTRSDDILVLDQSLSTAAVDDNGQPMIDQLRGQAKEWLRSRAPGSSVRILTTAGRPQWLTEASGSVTDGLEPLLRRLDTIRPVAARSNLASAVRFAATTELDRRDELVQPKRRVWVLTDGQASDWRLGSDKELTSFFAELEQETGVEIHLGIHPPAEKRANLSVGPLRGDGWRKSPGERLHLSTEVTNHSDSLAPASVAVWSIGSEEISRQTLAPLAAGESTNIEAETFVPSPGTHVVSCKLQHEDALPVDNRSDAVVELLDRIPVLLVTDREPANRRLGEAEFLTAALGQSIGQDSDRDPKSKDKELWTSVFKVDRTTSEALSKQSLHKYDVIVFLDAAMLPKEIMQRIDDYVHRGGGLWLFLGDHTEIDSFNRDWHAGGLGLSPVLLRSLELVESESEPKSNDESVPPDGRLHPPERDHATLQWLSDSTQTDLDEVLIRRFYSIHRPDSQSQIRTLLRTGGGNPIALLSSHGKGRVILQTMPMNPAWTNWPLTGAFVVMVDSWLRHLSEPRQSYVNLTPGTPLLVRVPASQSDGKVEIKSPGGEKIDAVAAVIDDARELRFSNTFESGVYRAKWKSQPKSGKVGATDHLEFDAQQKPSTMSERLYAVARPIEESNMDSVAKQFSQQLLKYPNLAFYDVASDAVAWAAGSGTTDSGQDSDTDLIPKLPIWTPLLYGLLAFLALELLLSSCASLRRFGPRWVGISGAASSSESSNPSDSKPAVPAPPEVPV